MKVLFLFLLCSSTWASDRLSRIGGFVGGAPIGNSSFQIDPDAARDPYRKAGGRYWNVAPLFTSPSGRVPGLPGWQKIWGTVAQNSAGGIFIDVRNYSSQGAGTLRFFVKNYPYKIPDGSRISLYALADGIMEYRTATGANATVAQFDYGYPYDPFAVAKAATNNVAAFTNQPGSVPLATNRTNRSKVISK